MGRVHPHRVEGSFCGGGQYRARSQPPRKVHGLSAWSCTRALLPAGGRALEPGVAVQHQARGGDGAAGRPAAERAQGISSPRLQGAAPALAPAPQPRAGGRGGNPLAGSGRGGRQRIWPVVGSGEREKRGRSAGEQREDASGAGAGGQAPACAEEWV